MTLAWQAIVRPNLGEFDKLTLQMAILIKRFYKVAASFFYNVRMKENIFPANVIPYVKKVHVYRPNKPK